MSCHPEAAKRAEGSRTWFTAFAKHCAFFVIVGEGIRESGNCN
jgi:hypothetical protein